MYFYSLLCLSPLKTLKKKIKNKIKNKKHKRIRETRSKSEGFVKLWCDCLENKNKSLN